jgi:hypothetical protein
MSRNKLEIKTSNLAFENWLVAVLSALVLAAPLACLSGIVF